MAGAGTPALEEGTAVIRGARGSAELQAGRAACALWPAAGNEEGRWPGICTVNY